MFSRNKKASARHGSASSVDLASQANGSAAQESPLATIPGSPSQPSKEAAHSSAAPSSGGGGRAFNFLVERARGAVGARPRTASDEGRPSTAHTEKPSPGSLPTSASLASITPASSGGRFFGRGSSTPAEASTTNSSQQDLPSATQETPPPGLPRSTGGFFSRKTTHSNPPKPGWLAKPDKQQSPSPLAPSTSDHSIAQKPPPSPSEPEHKLRKDKEAAYSRKQSLPNSESSGVSGDPLRSHDSPQIDG